MISHVVFDLDGTLIDSAPSILATLGVTLSSHGIEPKVPLEPGIIGPPLRETLSRLTGKADGALLDILIAAFKSQYDTVGYRATLAFPGVMELLQGLATRPVSLHIATNKRLNPTRLILEHLEWGPLFRHVYASDGIDPPYPSKGKMLAQLLKDIDLAPKSVAYIGDKLDDGLAADENSIPFFAACWGYGALDASELKPDWRGLRSPEELMEALVTY